MILFFQAVLLGLSLAAPLGPVNLLCFQKVVRFGVKRGAFVAMGAALGDAFFGSIGLLGLIQISDLSGRLFLALKCVGILFLLGMGIYLIKTAFSAQKTALSSPEGKGRGAKQSFLKGLTLTLSNPLTLSGVLLGMGSLMTPETSVSDKILLFIGVTMGSVMWWIILIALAITIKKRVSLQTFMHHVNLGTGVFILLFAVVLGVQTILTF
jgi:threonine/homoserine/homoserine lactone efflux protein